MTSTRFLVLASLATGLFTPIAGQAADLVGRGYYPEASRTVAYRYEECSLLRVIEPGRNEVVRVCYPPLDLDPRRGPVAGSSGGSYYSGPSYAVQ